MELYASLILVALIIFGVWKLYSMGKKTERADILEKTREKQDEILKAKRRIKKAIIALDDTELDELLNEFKRGR